MTTMASAEHPDLVISSAPPAMAAFTGGVFEMGSDFGAPSEQPRHIRKVAAFEIDRDLVTNAQFGRFARETGHVTCAEREGAAWGWDGARFANIPGLCWRKYATAVRSDHPVVLVSWNDATAYAMWAGKRLPTEAEWEYVASVIAGGETFPLPHGTDPFDHCAAGRSWEDGPGTAPVGAFGGTAVVRDLVGNVWQWCADVFSETSYADYVAGQPAVSADPSLRARRGGAWNVRQAFRLRCSNRGAYRADRCAPNLGFRCAR